MIIRLDKYLADMKVGTRSSVKDIIRKKQIKVNDSIITKPEYKINTDIDIVLFNEKNISYAEFEYYMLNKPAGVVSATEDNTDKTVIDLVFSKRKDLFPVGRLDKDTEGLLLITNDGEMAHNMLSPKKHVHKKYFANVQGKIDSNIVTLFEKGLEIDANFKALPAKLQVLSYNAKDDTSSIEIIIHEGKFHQIKRMFEAVNSKVLYLKRISFGPLILDENLKLGEYRALNADELKLLEIFK